MNGLIAAGATAPPRFSVVIPNYNRARTIGEAIGSVLAQGFADFEIVVVDDGSTDDSVARIGLIDDPRLRLVRQVNKGASGARNTGVDHARGVYVAFLDSDDRFLPNHLASLLALLEEGEDRVAYSQVIAERGNNRRIVKPFRALRAGESMADYLLRDRGFVQTSALALRRETAAAVRYREDVSFGDDTDFAIRLQLAGCRFVMTDMPSVIWMDTPRDDRLSKVRSIRLDLRWLDDLRPKILPAAYHGYLGWHAAKNIRAASATRAFALYLRALLYRAYPPRLALIVFLQIFLSERLYRWAADRWIMLLTLGRSAHAQTPIPDDGSGGVRGRVET